MRDGGAGRGRGRADLSVAAAPSHALARPSAALGPHERLELLCDPGSFRAIRTAVSASPRAPRSAPGDGVVGGAGMVGGSPVFCYAQDEGFAGGSLGAAHADTIVRVLRLAGRAGAPVVSFVASAGARVEEGVAALAGYGRVFRETVLLSGRVPQVSVVTGVSAGGGAYSPALGDFTVMSPGAAMFLTGPGVVREVTGETVVAAELGGPRVHSRNGVCHLVADGEEEAVIAARGLLGFLPHRPGEPPPRALPAEPGADDPAARVPSDARAVYDVREVIRALADDAELLELSERWGRSMVTGLSRIAGHPVGVVANQPRHLGGVIDAAAAEKAALFVERCDAFRLPLVVLVDTPGFLPGTRQERAGVIRHGAALLRAFAAARVPRLTVVLRKAYGGGYITMNSKDLGADLALAWPGSEIGIMGARQAVGILHRRELASSPDPSLARERLADAYAAERLSAEVAASEGHVDELVDPAETRARLEAALEAFA